MKTEFLQNTYRPFAAILACIKHHIQIVMANSVNCNFLRVKRELDWKLKFALFNKILVE